MQRPPILPALVLMICFATSAHAQWKATGVGVCTAVEAQAAAVACPDGAGGAIIAWLDDRAPYPPSSWGISMGDIYVQRLNSVGVPQWSADGVLVCAGSAGMAQSNGYPSYVSIAPDGTGGALITWHDYRVSDLDIYVQRIDAAGVAQWTANGVALTAFGQNQYDPLITTDGAGGAIVAWLNGNGDTAQSVYVRRINAAGIPQWQSGGIGLANWTSPSQRPSFDIASDGVGGAFVTWNGPIGTPANYMDILVQRVAGDGTKWPIALSVCTALYDQYRPAIIPSGTGAIIAWEDERNWPDRQIYAQRIDASGAAQWTTDGVPVCTAAPTQYRPVLATDGANGAIIAWDDYRADPYHTIDVYAQRITSTGAAQWTANGNAIAVGVGNQAGARLVADGAGGAIVAWTSDGGMNHHVFAQRIQSTGTAQWADGGIRVDMDPLNQYIPAESALERAAPAIVPDLAGGAILAYTERDASAADINAQHIAPDGSLPTGIGPTRAPLLFALSDNYPNPFSAGTFFDLTLERESSVRVDVFDASGRRVRAKDLGRMKAGPSRLEFDGLDERAHALPSGVYFIRVNASGESVTKKMVIAR